MTTFAKARLAALVLTAVGALASPAAAQRVHDLCRVEGIRQQHLNGVGLVIGLPGTGDNTRGRLTRMLNANILKNRDLDITEDDLRSKNVAVVVVTATISSATKVGSGVEVTVSSIGDAKSLKGGWLLETTLMGPGANPDTVYAIAQGGLQVLSEEEPTVGRGSAILEEDISMPFQAPDGRINLILHRPDFPTANRIARAINEFPYFVITAADELPIARAWDSGSVRVTIPRSFRSDGRVVDFISRIMGEVKVEELDQPGVVVIDSKSGVVTVNGRVRVAPVFVSIGDVQIKIPPRIDPASTEPPRFDPEARHPLLLDVLEELGRQGIPAQQLPLVIRSIDRAGALIGRLEEL